MIQTHESSGFICAHLWLNHLRPLHNLRFQHHSQCSSVVNSI